MLIGLGIYSVLIDMHICDIRDIKKKKKRQTCMHRSESVTHPYPK